MITMQFANEEEAKVLHALLDIATKAEKGGLQVAEAAIHFAKKIVAAIAASKVAPAEPTPAAKVEAPVAEDVTPTEAPSGNV